MLRALVVSLLGLLSLSGHAENGWKTLAKSPVEAALAYLRADTPKRGLRRDDLDLWQPSLGLGAQVEMTKSWALRLDVDRYRPKVPVGAGRDNLDSLMLSVQYRVETD
jgi:hypothetical protein